MKRTWRNRVSHLNASLEVIPLGHFLVLRRGNFSPSAQLLLGVVQVKDCHGIQPALEHQARQVLNVVLPAGEKYPRFQSGSRHAVPRLRLPRPGRSCNALGRACTSSRAVSARRVARTFRDRPRLARAADPAVSNGSFELDTRRNESWEIHGGSRQRSTGARDGGRDSEGWRASLRDRSGKRPKSPRDQQRYHPIHSHVSEFLTPIGERVAECTIRNLLQRD